jgi:hypothetical protein
MATPRITQSLDPERNTMGGIDDRNLLGKASTETMMYQPMAQGLVNLVGQEGAIKGSKPVQTAANLASKANPTLLKNTANAARLARLGSLATPAGILTGADLITSMIRDDNKGLFELGGEALGKGIGKAMYGSGDGYGENDGMRALAAENLRREKAGEPALSAAESSAFLKRLNPEAAPVSAVSKPSEATSFANSPYASLPYGNIALGQQQAMKAAEEARIRESLDATGAVQDMDQSEEMQILREENARREEAGLPDLSAPESVDFLEAVNPEVFDAVNEKFDNQDQQVVNNYIAKQRAAMEAMGDTGAPAAFTRPGSETNPITAPKGLMNRSQTQSAIAKAFGQDKPLTLNQALSENPNAVMGLDAQGRMRSFESPEAMKKNLDDAKKAFQDASLARQKRIGGTGSFEGDSAAREARLAARPDFNEVRRSKPTSEDGLTDAQRSRIYGRGSKEFEMSKAGINPQTGVRFAVEEEERKRERDFDEARIASLAQSDPTKLQEVTEQANALLKGYMGQDGQGMTKQQTDDLRREIMMSLLLPGRDTYDSPFMTNLPAS